MPRRVIFGRGPRAISARGGGVRNPKGAKRSLAAVPQGAAITTERWPPGDLVIVRDCRRRDSYLSATIILLQIGSKCHEI